MMRARSTACPISALLAAALGSIAFGAATVQSVAGAPARSDDIASAIGRVNIAGYNRRSHCTGALIAPDKVLTAAHCLKRRDGRPVQAKDIHFLPGADRGDYLAHGRGACVAFLQGLPGLKGDAAIVTLKEPIALSPLSIRQGRPLAKGAEIALAGYPRRRPHRLTIASGCRVDATSGGLFFADCLAEQGMSGGPVLTRSPTGQRQIAGIMVAVTKSRRTLALPAESWRDLATTPCASVTPSNRPAPAGQGSAAPR